MQCVAQARPPADVPEKLEDLCALLAVSMGVAPDEFPSWSDGCAAHLVGLRNLWSEIRPYLELDAEKSTRADEELKEMLAAFTIGNTDRGMSVARSLYAALSDLGRDRRRRSS